MSSEQPEQRPVILVVDDLQESYDTLLAHLARYQAGRLRQEFDFAFVSSFPELRDWYTRHRGRFVSLIVQDVNFESQPDERKLVAYPDTLRPLRHQFDVRALQGFLIYGYLRRNNIDRVAPVVFVSSRVGLESMSEFSEFIVSPGYGSCSFVPEAAVGDDFYPRICQSIDTLALRPLNEERRRHWTEQHQMVVGRSRKMAFLAYETERIGPSDAIVLLMGSPGVGKELVANALHRCSGRYLARDPVRERPCTVNMAALDRNLVEDELFGHDKGAFTGAAGERAGIFEAAQGSSVFLDEIGEIDHDVQLKLLRTMEYKRIKRLGSSTETDVDMRIIATTNRTIEDLQAKFRPDFYSRLVQHCILVPSLRERWQAEPSENVQSDLDEFFEYVTETMNRNPRHPHRLKIERTAVRFIRQMVEEYIDGGNSLFLGNMRTLRNIIERAYERAQYDASTEIGLGHIMPTLGMVGIMNAQTPRPSDSGTIEHLVGSLKLDAIERQAIQEALARTNNNQTQAADLLGIHRDTLRRKMAELNL
jgi:two-component system nitrogen regulation response regulator GlnG